MSQAQPIIGFRMRFEDRTKHVKDAVEKGAFRSFAHAAAAIRKDAIASIVKSQDPSLAGEPVHTRRGFAQRAIQYAADKTGAVIGFAASKISTGMEVHEEGGTRFGRRYPARPTMAPALEKNIDRFAASWRNSVS